MVKKSKMSEDLPRLTLVAALIVLVFICAGNIRFGKIDLSKIKNISYLFDLTGYCLGVICLVFVFFISENMRLKKRIKGLEELVNHKENRE